MLDVQDNTQLSGPIVPALFTSTKRGDAVSGSDLYVCLPDKGTIENAGATSALALITSDLSQYSFAPISCSATSLAPSSVAPVHSPTNSSHITPIDLSPALQSAMASVVYAALLSGGAGTLGRGSVPAIQRASASLRLAARCNAALTATNVTASYNDGNTMFSDLADNPLGVSIPVGAVDMSAAGGAAVMNGVLVVIIGATLHACALLQRCVRHRATSMLVKHRTISTTVVSDAAHTSASLLPASRLPGSLAVPYETLLQPGIGACVTLMVSSARTPASVACGVIVSIVWMLLPVYSVFAVVVRGGRVHDGVFALRSVSVGDTRQTKTSRRHPPSAVARALSAVQRAHRYATHATARWTVRTAAEMRAVKQYRRREEKYQSSHREYASYLLENMEAVFGGYIGGREWYFAVDWGVALVGGAVMGGAEAASYDGDACGAAVWGTWCAVVLGVVQVGALVALRPNSVRLELWSGIVLGLLGLLSVVLSLAGSDGAAESIAVVASLLALVLVVVLSVGTLAGKWMGRMEMVDSSTAAQEGESGIAIGDVKVAHRKRAISA
ncbi:GP46-like surface antigen, putative [Bodo saltans]|uniref:GP46-like surface antigen, putative n=1 Tax=Bodo saltans TaxID=75058 RepID=A0A0S4IQP3_BODSA|nr:GP46-like surface antigen, putative [Bodo saltans]|eukprot:CUF20612.1 GP46-like surface antigen, putative [Bodo saltans]